MVENQWREEHSRLKREAAETLLRKQQANEIAKDSMQKAVIQKQKLVAVRQAENERML